MTTETEVPTQVSNVTVVRDGGGGLSVWVGKERMLGTMAIGISHLNDGGGMLTLGVPSSRFRFAENEPAEPVYAKTADVLRFPTKPTAVPPKGSV